MFCGRVIGVDDAKSGLFEEPTFGSEIVVESFMIIKMFVSDVSHDSDFKIETESAKLSKSMGGDFEDEKFGTTICDSTDPMIEGNRVDCGHVFNLLDEAVSSNGIGF